MYLSPRGRPWSHGRDISPPSPQGWNRGGEGGGEGIGPIVVGVPPACSSLFVFKTLYLCCLKSKTEKIFPVLLLLLREFSSCFILLDFPTLLLMIDFGKQSLLPKMLPSGTFISAGRGSTGRGKRAGGNFAC